MCVYEGACMWGGSIKDVTRILQEKEWGSSGFDFKNEICLTRSKKLGPVNYYNDHRSSYLSRTF